MLTIYNYICLTLAIFLGIYLYSHSSVCAVPVFEDENLLSVDYSKFDANTKKSQAQNYFNKALKEPDKNLKNKYLKQAAVEYYILSNINKDDIENHIYLGRIYGMKGNDKYAKAYFYNALGIDYKNINANFYFGEYYYSKKNYKKALNYYKNALEYGYPENADILSKIGYIYERYGDLERASIYYKKSVAQKSNAELSKKIQEIDGANYSATGYNKKKLR